MDSYYFLHTGSLVNVNYQTYKDGLMTLNMLAAEMEVGEKRLKHEAVYDNKWYVQLFEDYAETDVLIKFIEQCSTIKQDISDDVMFGATYPNMDAGFLGVDFCSIIGIAQHRMVIDSTSLDACRKKFIERLIITGQDDDLPNLLKCRFPRYEFTNDARNDILWWKHNDNNIVGTLVKLLDDIPSHPFYGGLGKTEVLSKTKILVVSKRITHKDRLTYTYGETTLIHRCKEHY